MDVVEVQLQGQFGHGWMLHQAQWQAQAADWGLCCPTQSSLSIRAYSEWRMGLSRQVDWIRTGPGVWIERDA